MQRGGRVVTEEFDPYKGEWKEVGTGPKWDPTTGGGALTGPQISANQEIDTARTRLTELARSLSPGASLSDELQRRMSRVDEFTGLMIPDYNSYWGRIGWLAQQAKVGGDPEHNRWSKILIEPVPPPPIPLPKPTLSSGQPSQSEGQPQGNLFESTAPGVAPRPSVGPSRISQMNAPQLAQLYQNPDLTQEQRKEISLRLTALGY